MYCQAISLNVNKNLVTTQNEFRVVELLYCLVSPTGDTACFQRCNKDVMSYSYCKIRLCHSLYIYLLDVIRKQQ